MKLNLTLIALAGVTLIGCARFGTTQTDLSYENGQPLRTITTHASGLSFFASRATLATWKASQTDKTQGASVGNLSLESNATTNLTALVEAAVGAAVRAAKP